ncbi:MAG: molybdopterin cofactor-binding domain-containing protein [Parvibaculum sp.]
MKPTRRQLLLGGSVIGGGLLLGYATSGPTRPERAQGLAAKEGEHFVTTWLTIHPDNRVTVYVPHAEMGQGVHTSLPMMAAEEMEADWGLVDMVQAPADPIWANGPLGRGYLAGETPIPSALTGIVDASFFKIAEVMNLQITGGSTSVRFTGQWGMRMAGAAAKEMLIRAAADTWGVPEAELVARLSHVHHEASGRSASFGELAVKAAEYDPPNSPVLKSRENFTIIGTSKPRYDIPAKVDGSATYGVDVQMPGLKVAAIRQAPVFGGSVKSFDGTRALQSRGVSHVISTGDGVAVVADNYWRASQALELVDIEFDDGGNGSVSTQSMFAKFHNDIETGATEDDVIVGSTDNAFAESGHHLEARYEVPFLAHTCMEPMNCTVEIRDGKANVWVGVQDALGSKAKVAEIAGLSLDEVTLTPLMLGGGFGRRGPNSANFVEQATRIAMQVDAPVKLVWSREEDVQHDYYRPAVAAHLSASFDEKGNPTAWRNTYTRKDEPVEASNIPYKVANQAIRYVESPVHVPYGAWRSVAHTQHTFFNESFVDEMAHAAGKDPYAFRRDLLEDGSRHKAILDRAAKEAGWGTPLPAGRARGIAFQESFQTIVAQVVEVSLDEAGNPKVHRVVCAVDCGTVINPDGARAQIESGVIYGLTAALFGEITIEDGAVVQGNFTDYDAVRLAQSPKIEVHFIESDAPLGGMGEPGTPCIAPAVANALFTLTGTRVRTLPLMNHDFKAGPQLASAAD